MSEKNKTYELKEEELKQVAGGSKVGDAKFDNVTKILNGWVDKLWNVIPNDSVFENIKAASEKQFNGGRYTAIQSALNQIIYYDTFYRGRLTSEVYDQLKNDLNYCLGESES